MYVASQTWCLWRFLPLLAADKIPLDDEIWENYIQLMKIMDYIFSPSTTEVTISTLTVLIEDFLYDFCNLYPERRITPKIHYHIHIPSWMLRYSKCILFTRAWNNSRPLAIFWPISGIWLSKSNLLGQIYCTFSMEKPIIVYRMFLLLLNGRLISNPYFKLCFTVKNYTDNMFKGCLLC